MFMVYTNEMKSLKLTNSPKGLYYGLKTKGEDAHTKLIKLRKPVEQT